jgi:hypothetical protein
MLRRVLRMRDGRLILVPIFTPGVDRGGACLWVILARLGVILRSVNLGRGARLRMRVTERRAFGIATSGPGGARLRVVLAQLHALLNLLGGLVRAPLGMLTALSRPQQIGRRSLDRTGFGVIGAQGWRRP